MSGVFVFFIITAAIDPWCLDLLLHWRLHNSDILIIILFSNISWNKFIRLVFPLSTIKLLCRKVHIGKAG